MQPFFVLLKSLVALRSAYLSYVSDSEIELQSVSRNFSDGVEIIQKL
jgi:hypothetical protein